MRSLLRRLWPSPADTAPGPDLAPVSDPHASPPAWAVSLEQQMTKVARAQAKLSVRLDDIALRLDTLASHAAESAGADTTLDPTPLLDVLDRLDEARHALVDDRPAVERGLAALGARLEAVLGGLGVERVATRGVAVDPALFRVIGVQACAGANDGEVVRVVRAAARRGTRVIREGEVLIGRARDEGEP